MRLAAWLVLACTGVDPQVRAEREATSCAGTKQFAHSEDGWTSGKRFDQRVPAATPWGARTSMSAGLEYIVDVCGDASLRAVDVQLLDPQGTVVAHARGDRESKLQLTAPASGTYKVLVTPSGPADAAYHLAIAIVFR